MRAFILAVVLLGVSSGPAVGAPAQEYVAVLEKSVFECTTYKGPFSVSGTFRRYFVEAFIDVDDPANSRLLVTLDAASIVSAAPLIPDALLRSQLHVDVYPVITLRSTAIRATREQGVYEADVLLALMGATYRKTILIGVVREGQDIRIIGTIESDLKDDLRSSQSYDILLRRAA